MTFNVSACGTCPFNKLEHDWGNGAGFGTCRINRSRTYHSGSPPKECPLRDSAITVVLETGR